MRRICYLFNKPMNQRYMRYVLFLFLTFLFSTSICAQRKYILIDAKSEMGAYSDRAVMAVAILEHLFNSKQFRERVMDAGNQYDFDNVRKGCNTGSKIGNDSALRKYIGMLDGADTFHVQLKIIKKKKRKVMGSSAFKSRTIKTYTWWLSENRQEFLTRYTAHLAHEFSHVRGFCHVSSPPARDKNCGSELSRTFPYSIGCQVLQLLKESLYERENKWYLKLDGVEHLIQ